MILVAVTALHTYTDVVRHPERFILWCASNAGTMVFSRFVDSRWEFPVVCFVVVGNLEWCFLGWLGWIAIYILSSWFGGLGIGYAVHLGSVWAATSPLMAGVLTLSEENPREQAAFIYAPGAALALMGVALIFGAGATRLAIDGRMGFVPWVIAPACLGIIGWIVALKLADRHLIRAGMILSDIDAHWGGVESVEDERAVYLDWLATDHPHRLRLLRQSWRLHRWVTIGLWLVGAIVSLLQWLGDGLEVVLFLEWWRQHLSSFHPDYCNMNHAGYSGHWALTTGHSGKPSRK